MESNKLMNFLGEDEETSPIYDTINYVLNYPDEELNEDTVDVIKGMLVGAFTDRIKNTAVENIIKGFRSQNLSYNQVKEQISSLEEGSKLIIEELKTTKLKEAIVRAIFDKIIDFYKEAVQHYLVYDITLPIKLEEGAQVPTYAHDSDAAADIYAAETITIPAHSISNLIKTGVKIALPDNWVAIIVPRSSIGMKTGLRLSNSQGIIDPQYRGEIGVIYDNISDSDYTINKGDRIAQMYIMPVYRFKPEIVESLESTERGEGGYGSTGR